MKWFDKVNGSIGDILDGFLYPAGLFLSAIAWLMFDGLARIVIIAMGLLLLTGPLALRHLFPRLYKSASELDTAFQENRKMGRHRRKE